MESLFIIGRILLGGFFIYSAVAHFMGLEAMTGYAKSKKVPFAKAGVIISGILFLLGGLAILLNIYAVVGLWILVALLVITTLVMHQFWTVQDPMHRMNDRIQFSKNVAIIGALLILLS